MIFPIYLHTVIKLFFFWGGGEGAEHFFWGGGGSFYPLNNNNNNNNNNNDIYLALQNSQSFTILHSNLTFKLHAV